MKKIYIFFSFILILLIVFFSCPPTGSSDGGGHHGGHSPLGPGAFLWAKRIGGVEVDKGLCITYDLKEDVTITGYVRGDADMNGDGDSTDGGAESSAGYGLEDIFIVKFNSNGAYQWSKRLGGTSYDHGYSIITDPNCNIYIIGYVTGNADLNGDGDSTDGGAESSAGYGALDIFIAKFNAIGTHLWSKRLGGIESDGGNGEGITLDSDDNVIISGCVRGDADLNGDRDSTDGGAESSINYGEDDIIIVKFNSGGTHLWSKRLGGVGIDFGINITTDFSDNIIAIGDVFHEADMNGDGDRIDGEAESSIGYDEYDIVLVKFFPDGTYRWSKRLGGADTDGGECIITDSNGDIYATGWVDEDGDMNGDGDSTDGGAEIGYGEVDAFIVKFLSDGSYKWSKRLGGISFDKGEGIAKDNKNNIFAIGNIMYDADMNGDGDSTDGGTESSIGYGDKDIYIIMFDSSGIYQWSKRLGGKETDYGYGIIADNRGHIFATGSVTGDADMNGDGDSMDGEAESSSGYGEQDIFIVKLAD